MSTKKQISAIIVLTVILITVGGWVSNWVSAYSPDYYYQVQKNVELFGRLYQEISKKYVEEVDPKNFMRAGIDGMLATLDPYTVLIEKEDNDELQIMSSGKYGGLGMRIGMRAGWPTVVEPPFDGTPALRAGIREGDEIVEVDHESTKGKSISAVANLLRGEIGSEVYLKISREGEEDPIEFRLIRAEIVITDVAYAGLIKDGIGYIRLSHFSRNAGKDMENAIRRLKKEGLTALILDLRSNPGGLLDAAVSVSENFVPKGELIVSTQGRSEGSVQKYYSEKSPILEDLPLVVLVNGYSASASEITAGAIQDLDRGVILGSRTFGKGLVQTVIPLSGDAALKITTARYLVPSGRSIQDPTRYIKDPGKILLSAEAEAHNQTEQADSSVTDAEKQASKKAFYTEHGRKVYGGDGIHPDVAVEDEQLSPYELALLRKTMPFQFAVIYAAQHPELQRDFPVSEEMLNEFRGFLKEKGFKYTSQGEEALKGIEEIAQKEGYLASASPSLDELKNIIEQHKITEFTRSHDFIREELEQEISAKLWGTKAKIESTFDDDPVILRAVELLHHTDQYKAILQGKPKKAK